MNINQIQDEIVNEFSLLEGDQEMTIFYIMELGEKLPKIKEEDRTDANLVQGCQSKVWLSAELRNEKVFFFSDSNTAITKGLVSLLIRVFSGQHPEDIINAELSFVDRIGLSRFVGTQRSNGFAAMIKQMKYYALAFKAKKEVSERK